MSAYEFYSTFTWILQYGELNTHNNGKSIHINYDSLFYNSNIRVTMDRCTAQRPIGSLVEQQSQFQTFHSLHAHVIL
jgi:hypothetical protein